VLSVLDVRGFEIRDMFLMGFNPDCGSIIVPTRERAENVKAALEPAYAVQVKPLGDDDWEAVFDRRDIDGTVPSHLITGITLKDGTVVMKNGRWIR
jgi:hypothetical protein